MFKGLRKSVAAKAGTDCTRCEGVGWRWVPDARGRQGWAWAFCVTCQGTGRPCVRAESELRIGKVKPRPMHPPTGVEEEVA